MIRKMVEEGHTAFFLESIGIDVGERGVPPKVQDAIERILNGQKLRAAPVDEAQQQRRHGAGMADVNIRTTVAAKSSEEGDTGPAQGLPPSREEQEMRTREEYLREKALLDHGQGRIPPTQPPDKTAGVKVYRA